MYDELLERLRSVKDSWQTEEENLMLQAADAIEALVGVAKRKTGKDAPLTDYISREAAKEELCRDCEACGGDKGACAEYRFIQTLPAADVRPVVKGKWVYDHWCEFKCSNCGAWSKSKPYRGRENFCPNCGADMREES